MNLQDIWDTLITIAYILILISPVLIASGLFAYFMIQRQDRSGGNQLFFGLFDLERLNVTLSENKTFSGLLVMVTYGHTWWGWGNIGSTQLDFAENVTFVFGGELKVEIGSRYVVEYRLSVFGDNHTEICPLNVKLFVEGD